MMDSKNALEEAGGDMEKAADILRKKGVIKAAKRADKVAAEGMVVAVVNDDRSAGAAVEVNCETDFVAKSPDFVNFSKQIAQAVLEKNPADLAALHGVTLGSGETVETVAHNLTLKIGEKIVVRRLTRFAASAGFVHSYAHGTKISVLVELSGAANSEVGTDVAMHIAASNPKYLDRSQVDASLLDRERAIYSEQLKQQGKPEAMIEKIVGGKLDKFYGEICLVEQPFIKDEDKKVGDYAKTQGATIVRFVRYELGEGIEKATKDFASEVAEQMK